MQNINFTGNSKEACKSFWKVIHTDNSLEFGKAFEDLSWNHCTSTPHRSGTNGIAEKTVRRVKEGKSAVLLRSSLDENWWADSTECYTYLRNAQDLLSDGKTPYERRFWKPLKGPIFPFGSLVEWYFISAKDQSRIHHFERKSYLDYSSGTHCTQVEFGRVTYWSQTLKNWKTMDASEIYSKRLYAKEVKFHKENDTGTSNSRRRSKKFSGRIRAVSTMMDISEKLVSEQ